MNGNSMGGRRITTAVAGVIALASAIVVLAAVGTHESHAAGHEHADVRALHRAHPAHGGHDLGRDHQAVPQPLQLRRPGGGGPPRDRGRRAGVTRRR
jgi:hypothetical protein